MDELNWTRKESYTCTGTFALRAKIDEMAQKHNTNIVLTRIQQDENNQTDEYVIEVWVNFKSHCNIINAFRKSNFEEK